MWHEILDKNNYIKSLYTQVPSLINVRINAIKVEDEGQRISLEFIMPTFAHTPPKKWINLQYNAVYIKLDFFQMEYLTFKLTKDKMQGNISIEKSKENKLKISIVGNVNLELIARYGMIQSVDGYIEGAGNCD